MSLMNPTIYNYFRNNYGCKSTISEEEIALKERYKHFSKKDLKKELKTLKLNNASINIIKYIAKEIRSRINKNPINITVATGNHYEIDRNFWGYAKKSSDPAALFFHLSTLFRVLPTLPTHLNV